MIFARHLPRTFLALAALAFFPASGRAAEAKPASGRITLEQAYDKALATDQSIRIAYWEVRKANLLPWSALARLGPQITASGGYSRGEQFRSATVTETEVIPSAIAGGTSTTRTNRVERTTRSASGIADVGISFQQPLVDLTVFPAYRAGKISTVIARLQHQYTVRGTLFGVVDAYYEVLKQQRLVDVNREALRLAGQQLEFAQARANVGEVTRADVLRATVVLEEARRTLVESENVLEFSRNTLRNILNLAPDAPLEVVEPPDYPSTLPPFETLLAQAYADREDLRVKVLTIDQDIARRNEIIGNYGPRVVAQFDTGRNNISGTSASSSYDWQAAVSVQVPIFMGGQREIDLMTANRDIEQARLERERTAKEVESQVKQAWLTVRTLQQTLKALKSQVVAAEQSYHDLEIQYRAGTATSVDVLSALNQLNTARKDLAVQMYDYQVALRDLEQSSGVFQQARVQRSKIP